MSRSRLTSSGRDTSLRPVPQDGSTDASADSRDPKAHPTSCAKPARKHVRDSATTDGKPVSARLSPVEIEALEQLKAAWGYGSNSDALRALVRAASGLLEFDPVTAGKLDALRGDLQGIGASLTRIALAGHRGRIDLVRQEWAAVEAARQSLPAVRLFLQAMVDEHRRRGTRMFQAFQEARDG